MKICGIVAEYNPFHNGHAYHCTKTRELLGSDTAIVAIMSGNFVQRGDFALLDKYQRAAMAVQSGVDLVIELPLPAALSSAEQFARGAIDTLNQMGCITHLSFGSECGDLEQLRHAARLDRTSLTLNKNLSYAAALQQAFAVHDPKASALFSHPNNTLGIEYCAALDRSNSCIQPITIKRTGAPHDSTIFHAYPSASFVRTQVKHGQSYTALMPKPAQEILSCALADGAAPVSLEHCSHAILCYLRRLSADVLLQYCGGTDGLHNRLYQAITRNPDLSSILCTAQTRRYPLARIRRALLRAYLDLPISLDYNPQYLRVLAIGPYGRIILRSIQTTLPVIVKPITEKKLPSALQPALQRDVLADELFTLAQPNPNRWTGGQHYQKSPFVYAAT